MTGLRPHAPFVLFTLITNTYRYGVSMHDINNTCTVIVPFTNSISANVFFLHTHKCKIQICFRFCFFEAICFFENSFSRDM